MSRSVSMQIIRGLDLFAGFIRATVNVKRFISRYGERIEIFGTTDKRGGKRFNDARSND